mmetsp:Transcript_7289/g.15593  ORF Transcript_7289/g.15593 Transcript_7289/m.15593 type:complete len:229 (+) Transcript_7289:437-1123(+)
MLVLDMRDDQMMPPRRHPRVHPLDVGARQQPPRRRALHHALKLLLGQRVGRCCPLIQQDEKLVPKVVRVLVLPAHCGDVERGLQCFTGHWGHSQHATLGNPVHNTEIRRGEEPQTIPLQLRLAPPPILCHLRRHLRPQSGHCTLRPVHQHGCQLRALHKLRPREHPREHVQDQFSVHHRSHPIQGHGALVLRGFALPVLFRVGLQQEPHGSGGYAADESLGSQLFSGS